MTTFIPVRIMNFEHFRGAMERDEQIADYIDELTQEIVGRIDRTAGVDLLFGVVVYAFYRSVKNYFDHQQGLQSAALRKLLEAEVEELASKGWSRGEALRATLSISDSIANLSASDPIITAGLAILRKPG